MDFACHGGNEKTIYSGGNRIVNESLKTRLVDIPLRIKGGLQYADDAPGKEKWL